MSILERIERDLKEALKNREEVRLSVLRLIKASIKNRSIEKQSVLNDEEIMTVLSTQIKQRKESIEHYLRAQRDGLAVREQEEIEIIKSYMPQQLTNEEIDSIIKGAIVETKAATASDIGKVMKIVMPQTRGKADGKYINERVKALLSI